MFTSAVCAKAPKVKIPPSLLSMIVACNEGSCEGISLRWMVPVFRFFKYVNFERKEQKINSTS